ncbi:ankyrin repeat and LEM domain-containing protein 2 isoform X2 [Pseudonaja textilis]|uniref:ankyrin repeat and LEM domain-containing protein 2 isoform X2 n=1 Tax=Pseudonaja textilis TaxID=8673 RepID=UPI000EA87101|nr:ankyrin repeat and LEM domain-containing protein 2 isoform X2 [Pseudonaja textilis]
MERWVAGGLWRAGWAGWPAWELLAACAVIGALGWLLRLLERGPRGRGPRPSATPPSPPPPAEERPPRCFDRCDGGRITMDEIFSRLKQLTPDELREEIVHAGLKCGPITLTTRSIFEKRLAQALWDQQGASEATAPFSNGVPGTAASGGNQPESGRTNGHLASPEEGDFGYSVGLNPPEEEALLHEANGSPARSQNPSKEPVLYYGVCPVYDDILTRNERVHVYEDKKEALQAVKMIKGSRFKAFSNREDAEKFAKGVCDYFPSPNKSAISLSPVKVCSVFGRDGLCSPELETVSKERANSYKSPRTQDLTAKLRKAVEKGDESTFLELIWSNPRYLIGSGDNPTIVQEGCRYNVMHVAAKENQPGICRLLLDTLENPEFMRLMYPDDDTVMLEKRISYIVDLYLNTPDKTVFDTPLHFACKFGNPEVVGVLVSHPAIVKNPKNKYSQTPADVICERNKNKSADLKAKIREHLEGQCYVPLFRAEDNATSPMIGAPWSPDQTESSPLASLPRYLGSPKDPMLTVRAYAGPLSPSKAEDFRRLWKTPPRERAEYFYHLRKSDLERGVERVGRELAHELGFPWVEYWEFLGCFVDLSSQEGLGRLEDHLSQQQEMSNNAQLGENEAHNKPPQAHGKSKNCNSVSVGAFLDDDDMSLEEVKNRQNAARNYSPVIAPNEAAIGPFGSSKCDILSIEHTGAIMPRTKTSLRTAEKGDPVSKNGYCSPAASDDRTGSHRRHPSQEEEENFQSPVANLMDKFGQLSCQDPAVARECLPGKPSQKVAKTWKCPEQLPKMGSLLSKAGAAARKGKEAKGRKEEGDPQEAEGPSAETEVRTGERKPPGTLDSPLGMSPPGLLKSPPSNGRTKQRFLSGDQPSKWDDDVLTALLGVEIDPQRYPAISKWSEAVRAYPASERRRWSSPSLKGFAKGQATTSPARNLPYFSPGKNSPGKYNAAAAGFSPDLGSPGRYTPAYVNYILLSKRQHFSGLPNP